MGRPRQSEVLGTFCEDIKRYIVDIRKKYPGWGAKTIHAELSSDPRLQGVSIPSIRSIGSLLKVKGLVRHYGKHVTLPDSRFSYAKSPHQVWQLDAQGGFILNNIGPIAMINVKDVYSRTYCMAYPNRKKTFRGHSRRQDYQSALRLAFMEYGLPQMLQTDHESVFYENKGQSPFPTQFHLWIIGLGINKVFGRFGEPTDQAMVERMHQTIQNQAIKGIDYLDWNTLLNFCQQRRQFLNQTFPCSSLENKAPYEAFPKARHSGRYYHPQREAQMLDLTKVYTYLAKGRWYRVISSSGTVTLGGNTYYIKRCKPKAEVMITFNGQTKLLSFYDDKERLIQKLPIKGLNKKTLMGDVFWKMVNVQLELPLCWDTQKATTTFLHNT